MVDKNLFLHDLAIVAIMKNEAPYIKEWLDYHLLAGVDHFYIYDNDSPDNQAEVVKPYVEAGIVDYFFLPGKVMQLVAYNDAIRRFKFHCRYMAFIDGDEFIFPKANQSVAEVVGEILSSDSQAAGLAVNWQIFGSNGHVKADYSRGVLERFTRRAEKNSDKNKGVKTIANPRLVDFIYLPHCAHYFEGYYAVNEKLGVVNGALNYPVTAEKIVVNHYNMKSREEFYLKQKRGRADVIYTYSNDWFNERDRNEEFDDDILSYRAARAEKFSLEDDRQKLERVTEALIENISLKNLSVETALTCRALSKYLRERFPNDADYWKICEETSLKAIAKTTASSITFAEAELLLRELPNLLILPYPAVEDLRGLCLKIISQLLDVVHFKNMWKDYVELEYLHRLLQTWK